MTTKYMTLRILFLNHKEVQCGVYQYGKRLVEILQSSSRITYIYEEVSSENEFKQCLQKHHTVETPLHGIIYNYHGSTMPWLTHSSTPSNLPRFGISHESRRDLFTYQLSIDPTESASNTILPMGRPLCDPPSFQKASTESIQWFLDVSEENVPVFGSFGFGFSNKGFHKIVNYINRTYEKAIIKFVIPHAFYDPHRDATVHQAVQACQAMNTNPNIQLLITHDFFTTNDLLLFLQSTTANIFLYDVMHGRGISSTIDYALSVDTPLVISDSYMFRHIYHDSICLYKSSLESCIEASREYCKKFKEAWKPQRVCEEVDDFILAKIV